MKHRRPWWHYAADLTAWTAIAAVSMLVLGYCSGCGGALGAHARAASIAVLALQGADDLAETSALVAVAACSDEACLATVEHTTEAIDAGVGSAALAVSAYVEAVRIAAIGGESPDLLAALVMGLLRLLREWGALAALYAPLGVELPALPASVSGLGAP